MSSEEAAHAQRRDEIAQEMFKKSFEQCDPHERIQVGGTLGGETRKEQMAEQEGGDAAAAYSAMGKKGGEARKEQMAEEKGGSASAAYAELGQKGGQKTNE